MKQKIVEKIYEPEKSRKANMVEVSGHTGLFQYGRDAPPLTLNSRFEPGARKILTWPTKESLMDACIPIAYDFFPKKKENLSRVSMVR